MELSRGTRGAHIPGPEPSSNRMINRPLPERPLPLLVAILAALLALRVIAIALSEAGLYFDEAQYWVWGQELALGYYSKPPLIGWLLGGMTAVCGDSPFCVRLPSPILHTVTALLLYGVGSTLFSRQIGFWTGLVYATLPGVSFSSHLMSTDVLLAVFWSLALLAVVRLRAGGGKYWAAILGIAIGFGLLAKYAMVYFVLCLAVAFVLDRQVRQALSCKVVAIAAILAGLVISPNLLWNAQNSFATVTHLSQNANWTDNLGGLTAVGAFLGAQFGVFGPILFAVYLVCLFRPAGDMPRPERRVLIAFSAPVLIVISVQAFLSEANANWAAMAFPAAAVLVTATIARAGWRRLFKVSLAIQVVIPVLLFVAYANASRITLPDGRNPFWSTLGWEELSERVAAQYRAGDYVGVITHERATLAELIYHLRDTDVPLYSLYDPRYPPRDHFGLSRPYLGEPAGPLLYVTHLKSTAEALLMFAEAEHVATEDVYPRSRGPEPFHFYRLTEFTADVGE